MTDLPISKPQADEFTANFAGYIALVPDGDVLSTLATQIHGTVTTLRAVSDADSLKRYAADKWSVREVVGHMIDGDQFERRAAVGMKHRVGGKRFLGYRVFHFIHHVGVPRHHPA